MKKSSCTGCWTGVIPVERKNGGTGYAARVGSWYWIGVSLGIGLGAGVLLAGLVGARRAAVAAGVIVAGGIGAAVGYGFEEWQTGGWIDRLGGVLGGVVGVLAAAQIVRGTLRRGGTRGGTATLVAGAALVVAALAWVPALGYVEALALPGLVARLRRRSPERYAGLRSLARD